MLHVSNRIVGLRILHGIMAVYFVVCLVYLYVVALTGAVNETLFTIAVLSLAAECIAVFVLNNGDCPLIHVQRKIGDDKPFFELLVPSRYAKRAIPFFATLTVIALLLLLLRFVHD